MVSQNATMKSQIKEMQEKLVYKDAELQTKYEEYKELSQKIGILQEENLKLKTNLTRSEKNLKDKNSELQQKSAEINSKYKVREEAQNEVSELVRQGVFLLKSKIEAEKNLINKVMDSIETNSEMDISSKFSLENEEFNLFNEKLKKSEEIISNAGKKQKSLLNDIKSIISQTVPDEVNQYQNKLEKVIESLSIYFLNSRKNY